ncbi:MAG: DnaD domain protein [Caldilineaceae bacterium]
MASQKTTGFIGFPDKKMKPVIIPDHFFTDLLPQIEDMAELKLTLHCFWLLNEQSGDLRYLRGDDLRSDEKLLASLTLDNDLRAPKVVLEDALRRAVARNTLLRLEIETDLDGNVDLPADSAPSQADETEIDFGLTETVIEEWYFMNTVKGRQTLALIRQGKLGELLAVLPQNARLHVERPNIFVMYEQNVGFMSPMIADQLRDMEKSYSPAWIEEAFEIAVSQNARKLSYIQAVLKRWETDGRDPVGRTSGAGRDSGAKGAKRYEEPGRNSEQRRKKYTVPDEFSDIIIG